MVDFVAALRNLAEHRETVQGYTRDDARGQDCVWNSG